MDRTRLILRISLLALLVSLLFQVACSRWFPERQQDVPLLCYLADTEQVPDEKVDLETQFGTEKQVEFFISAYVICEAVHKRHNMQELPQNPPDILPLICYRIRGGTFERDVLLQTQFDEAPLRYTVKDPDFLCDPVTIKEIGGVPQSGRKYQSVLKGYDLRARQHAPGRNIFTVDQFGQSNVNLLQPLFLLEPAIKNNQGRLGNLKPLVCFGVIPVDPLNLEIVVTDQFFPEQQVNILFPILFCDPSQKTILPSPPPPTT